MQRDAVERLLPTMFQLAARPGSPLDAALHVMADLHEPDEALLADIDAVFDPYRAPDEFVPWLTRWVGLEWLVADESIDADAVRPDLTDAFPPGLGRLRDVVAAGSELAQRRGTEAGLRLFLSTATGLSGFVVTEPPDRPFHLVVTAPAEAEPYAAVLRRIVAATKPVYTTAELTFIRPFGAAEPAADPPGPSTTGPLADPSEQEH
jgi:phage tail-like protein